MILSDEKIIHMSHILLKGLKEKGIIELKEDEQKIRKQIRNSIIKELKLGEEVDEIVRKKLQSYSRKIIEGGQEWEVLYKKFFREEMKKRGR